MSFGALGDSFYEYLLKMWILKGRHDEMYRGMWERAMDEMIARLVFRSKEGLTYIAEFDRWVGRPSRIGVAARLPVWCSGSARLVRGGWVQVG